LTGKGSAIANRVALDLVKAEAWRASWQLRATAILEGLYVWRYKPVSIGPLLTRVRDGFAAESRLSGIGLRLNPGDSSVSADADEEGVVCGVTGAVIATAGLMEGLETPEITLTARGSTGKGVTIDVAQDAVSVPGTVVGRFLDGRWSDRPGGWLAAIGAGAAKVMADNHSGESLFLPRDGRGSTVRLTLGR
jgi:hypothetical protein